MKKYVFLISAALISVFIYIKVQKRGKRKKRDGTLLDLVGGGKMILLESLSRLTGCKIYGKVEFTSLGGSPKDRVALAIINDAERRGLITPDTGCTIFEGTVGSTGISLATIAKVKGYKAHIVMPDDVAIEKGQLLTTLGATVEKVRPCSIIDPEHFVNIARSRALEMNEMAEQTGSVQRGFFCDQFENIANFQAHYHTTGPEIYKQMGGDIDVFVMGAGTGGTISGVGTYLKENCKKGPLVILADPQGSGLYNKIKHNTLYSVLDAEGTRKRHQIDTIVEGVGLTRLTKNFEKGLSVIDDAIRVYDQEVVEMSRYLLENDGIFVGSSSAVNCIAALKVARRLGPGYNIVTILCDSGSRHQSKLYNLEFLSENGLSIDSNILGMKNSTEKK